MALDSSNSSDLEQLALKVLRRMSTNSCDIWKKKTTKIRTTYFRWLKLKLWLRLTFATIIKEKWFQILVDYIKITTKIKWPTKEMLVVCCCVARQMPWLQLSDGCLWSASENQVECFLLSKCSQQRRQDDRLDEFEWRHRASGRRLHRDGRRTVRLAGVGDVCRFVYRDGVIIAGTRSVCVSLQHWTSVR